MSVKLRLKRMGRRNRPFYRIAVMDTRSPRGGKTIELLGYYDPVVKGSPDISVDKERAEYWLNTGAQPSETVLSIFRNNDITVPIKAKRKKRRKKRKSTPEA